MSEGQLYELAVSATGEVRDAAGHLVSSSPLTSKITITEAQLKELGLTPPEESA